MSEFENADSKGKNPKEAKPLYTNEDYSWFIEARKKFKGNKEINGVLASPFEQYVHALRTITLGKEHNRFVVHDPEGYTKLNAMNTRYEAHEYHKDQDFMNQNPEVRTDLQKRIAEMRKKLNFTGESTRG